MAGRTKLKKRQVDDQIMVGTATGTTDYIAANLNPVPHPLAYATGQKLQIKPLATSTGNMTINAGGMGVIKVMKTPTVQATTNDFVQNQWYFLVVDLDLDGGAGGALMTSTGPTSGGSGTPGGADRAVQYNNLGDFGGNANLTLVESSPGIWELRLATASASNEGRLLLGGTTGLGAIEFGAGGEIRGALGLDIKVEAGANGWRLYTNSLQRLRISDAGELMAGITEDPGTAGQRLTSAGPGAPFLWQTVAAWSTGAKGEVERSTQAEALATADAAQAGDNSALSGDRAFSELEMYDFIRAMSRLLEGGTFSSIVNLTNNRRKYKHTIAGAVAYTKTGTYAAKHEGNIRVDYMTANGVNKPTFSSDFIVVWDNWLNTNGQLNTITFEYLPSGKIAVDMRYD